MRVANKQKREREREREIRRFPMFIPSCSDVRNPMHAHAIKRVDLNGTAFANMIVSRFYRSVLFLFSPFSRSFVATAES